MQVSPLPDSSTGAHRPLKVGLFLPTPEGAMAGTTARWSDLLAIATTAEAVGFDSLWIPDHFIYPVRGEMSELYGQWDCLTLLSALAAVTRRIELGSIVACTAFRNPTLLAKMADTLDEISGGRFILGLGAGWNETEFRAFGYPFDHRVARFEEALTIIHGLLKEGAIDFCGTYYEARECVLRPRGPRPQGPPIMIGSVGPRMLRLVARYADAWNIWAGGTRNSVAGVAPLRALVDAACVGAGRDPATLERTVAVLVEGPGSVPYPHGYAGWYLSPDERGLIGSPEALAAEFRAYADAGISHLQIWVNPTTVAGVEAFAPVFALLDRT